VTAYTVDYDLCLEAKSAAIEKLDDIPNISARNQDLLQILTLDINDIDIDMVSTMIQEDPRLSAKILGIANSAYFSSSKSIFTVEDAIISVLGLKLTSSLLISLLLEENIGSPSSKYFSMRSFWTNSLTSAYIAKKLAIVSPNVSINPDDAYLCGLLNNVGLLALATLFEKQYDAVLATENINSAYELLVLEREIIGIDHNYAGEILAMKWNLPDQIIESFRHCFNSQYNGEYKIHCILARLSSDISYCAVNGIESNHVPTEELNVIGIDEEEFQAIKSYADEVFQNIDDLSRFLANE